MIEQLHARSSEHTQPDTGKSLSPNFSQLSATLAETIKRSIIRQAAKPVFPDGIYFDGVGTRLKREDGTNRRISSDEILRFCQAIKFYNMYEEIDVALTFGIKLRPKDINR